MSHLCTWKRDLQTRFVDLTCVVAEIVDVGEDFSLYFVGRVKRYIYTSVTNTKETYVHKGDIEKRLTNYEYESRTAFSRKLLTLVRVDLFTL